jgi:hypothetical protein
MVATAVVQQIGYGSAHAIRIDGIKHIARHLARPQKPSLLQCGKVKGQARGGMTKLSGNFARWQPLVAMGHQEPHEVQPGFMSQGGQGGQDFTLLHASITHEPLKYQC